MQFDGGRFAGFADCSWPPDASDLLLGRYLPDQPDRLKEGVAWLSVMLELQAVPAVLAQERPQGWVPHHGMHEWPPAGADKEPYYVFRLTDNLVVYTPYRPHSGDQFDWPTPVAGSDLRLYAILGAPVNVRTHTATRALEKSPAFQRLLSEQREGLAAFEAARQQGDHEREEELARRFVLGSGDASRLRDAGLPANMCAVWYLKERGWGHKPDEVEEVPEPHRNASLKVYCLVNPMARTATHHVVIEGFPGETDKSLLYRAVDEAERRAVWWYARAAEAGYGAEGLEYRRGSEHRQGKHAYLDDALTAERAGGPCVTVGVARRLYREDCAKRNEPPTLDDRALQVAIRRARARSDPR